MNKKMAFLVIIVMLLFMTPLTFAELTGEQIMAKVDELMPNTGTFTMDLTLVRPGKDNRTSRIKVFVKGSDKILVRYLAPAEEKGQGYLRLGEDEWLYLPNANKSMRVSGRQSMQGSDLSNDDILKLKLSLDYDSKIVGEENGAGQNLYILELVAKRPTVAYGKLIFWVDKTSLLPTKTEYYAISGKLMKTMTYSQNKELGGRVRPTVMEITSELRKGYRTVMSFTEADYKSDLPDQLFTKLNLEKGK
jgi:outer membrane lipoprotein-sorting protein